MCIAISLFIFLTYLMNMSVSAVSSKTSFHKDFLIQTSSNLKNVGYTEKDYNDIANIKGVKKVYRVMQSKKITLITDNQMTGDYKANHKDQKAGNDKNTSYEFNGIKYKGIPSDLFGYGNTDLDAAKSHIIDGRIDINAMNKGNGVLLYQKSGGIAVTNYKVGDTINIISTDGKSKPNALKIVGVLDGLPYNYNGGNANYSIISTENTFKKITGTDTFSRFDIEVDKNADKNAIGHKLEIIAGRVQYGCLLDYRDMNSGTLFIGMIFYGLVTVISLIGVINIINTINTNLILRIREFGTLRAVGMTMKQRFEGILYGIIGTFYGSIIGVGLSWLQYNNINRLQKMTWHTPWTSIVEAAVVSILIGLFATSMPMKRIAKMNVVDSIRIED